ncbi:MAG: ATP synthase F0 subunit B [Desulfobulbus sp.]|jgi:F-type H+-transporting ATPase subunit b|uniref:ATP synthase F0 subunit B n=1 Tax=Desulfobulbus sp. TaxID=895 RepID=UPI00284C568B|nr:ATP synthase F0 subunit B [Desulfobulbus sp.]MDR2550637.1 ATP synthase F0 subunit B [Desulfobulbus sp.]
MKAWKTTLLPVLLALLIGALPPAVAVATNAPAAGAHQEAGAAEPPAVGAAAHQVVATDHGTKADAHGDAHSSNPLSSEKLQDLFWRTINFVALVIILVKFGAKPILSGLSGRQQRIREDLDDLTIRRDEAERSYREFEAKLAGMEKEMELIVERAIAQAQVEKERILADAEKAASDIKRQAEAAVQTELEDAKRQLREEIAEQAAAMAEELIVKNLTSADQVAITEQYLERVGAVQ